MPYVRVRIATANHEVTSQAVATAMTDLAVQQLGKNASAAAVDVKFTDPADWFIGGQALSEHAASSFFVEIKITAGTNSRDQEAGFIAGTFAAMKRLLGPVAPTSYVVVQAVDSAAWGYGGVTQERRYITGE